MNLYRIKSISSETQHRQILDQVDPKQLNKCFADIFGSSDELVGEFQ